MRFGWRSPSLRAGAETGKKRRARVSVRRLPRTDLWPLQHWGYGRMVIGNLHEIHTAHFQELWNLLRTPHMKYLFKIWSSPHHNEFVYLMITSSISRPWEFTLSDILSKPILAFSMYTMLSKHQESTVTDMTVKLMTNCVTITYHSVMMVHWGPS